eukprot:gene1294-1727_t
MDGLTFLRQLRTEPGGAAPKVIFCSGETEIERIREALDAGADEYIMKPFDREIVEAKFAEVGSAAVTDPVRVMVVDDSVVVRGLIVRRDGARIVYANAAYAALLGLDETQIIGSAAQPHCIACRPALALEGGARVFDECVATPEGERWISWVETVVPVALGQSVLQRVGRDITARIAAEQELVEARARAESANEAKSRFLAVEFCFGDT